MRWEQTVEYAALSDIGFRRQNNEDSCAVLIAARSDLFQQFGHMFLVADGMGGHAVGELASKMAADAIPLAFQKSRHQSFPDALRRAIEEANTAIHNRGERNTDFRRMGTTCTTLVLCPEGALIGHIGDSRCYRIRGHRIDQLTFDHSLQWEMLKQSRQRQEDILLQQPRNVITRCLGPEPTVKVDIEGPYAVAAGDVFVLCSDGLSGLLQDAEIGLIAGHLPPIEACRLLVDLANLRGGTDNITAIVARVKEIPPGLSDNEIPVTRSAEVDPKSWWWFAAWCIWLIWIAIAFSLMLTNRLEDGLLLMFPALAALGGLIIGGLRMRPKWTPAPENSQTVVWRPHRSAQFKLNSSFLSMLVGLEQVLQTTAHEEGWTVDWECHRKAFERMSMALANRQLDVALSNLGKAIHSLMSAIQGEKKRMEHAAKWGGKTPMPLNRGRTPPSPAKGDPPPDPPSAI